METLPDNQADVFWPMANPPPLPDELGAIKDSAIDLLVEDWLERALRKAMPESVQSIFFTVISPGYSRLNTNVRMILRNGEAQRELAAKFDTIVNYNILNDASLLQSVHFSDYQIGRTAIFLTADQPEVGPRDLPPHTALAHATFQGVDASRFASDGSSLNFNGWRVAMGKTPTSGALIPDGSPIPSVILNCRNIDEVTPYLQIALDERVNDPNYRAHVWPVLEAANVLMVVSPAFHISNAQQRQRVGSCGLNLMLSRGQPVHPSVIETALQLARQLDSLFGTVQNLHHAQTRRRLTFEALNIISHSLKNRVDRLSGVSPDCARDLHVQKLSSLGAGQLEKQTAFVFDTVRTKLLWKRSGFLGESITTSLRSSIWSDRSDWNLDLSILEDLPADARWVTLIEELMENLHKRNISFKPAELKVALAADGKSADIRILGAIRKAQWDDLVEKLTAICRQGDDLDFKGLNVILAIAHRLSTLATRVEYCCGLEETALAAIEEHEQWFGELPVHLRWGHSLSADGCIFAFAINITNLTLPAHV